MVEPAKTKEAAQETKTGPLTCAKCSKPLKKRWYYRNQKYFCNKRCWKATQGAPAC